MSVAGGKGTSNVAASKQSNANGQKGGKARVAYDDVLERIVSRELPCRTVIQERKLAESLGVSRIPMREAVGRLEGEGWRVRLTDRLLSVKVVTRDEYLQVLPVRRLLETRAVVLATPRIQKDELKRLRADVKICANTKTRPTIFIGGLMTICTVPFPKPAAKRSWPVSSPTFGGLPRCSKFRPFRAVSSPDAPST